MYAFPDWVPTDDMVQMILSDFVINSGGYVYWQLGEIVFSIKMFTFRLFEYNGNQ
jgi:hypothetical protein